VLVHLGDTEKAHSMLALGTDPTERTAFIHGLDRWYGDLSDYGKPLRETTDDSFRSGLCLAVGRIPVGQVPAGEQQVMEQVLLELYQTASDGSIHSACDWALRQWNVALPAIAAEKAPTNKDWHVNTLGMTMVKIPAGSTKSFWISNREVSVAQFQRFMDDDAAKEKPTAWRGPDKEYSPTGQHPVQEVSWYDAVLFCNWLSGKENLTPCYERTGDKEQFTGKQYDAWRVVPKTNGYRLPTAAEWEYACRAQTKTYFCFGSQDPLLDQYAVYRASATQPCGTKLPNGWGVFDMHGNVYEWVYDNYDTGSARVYRGGSWYDPARGCRASNHQGYDPPFRRYYLGFRLAAVPTSREPAGGAVAGKPAVLERKAAR
jgi:formylglycine-generating enzyme required for sulfatase activity